MWIVSSKTGVMVDETFYRQRPLTWRSEGDYAIGERVVSSIMKHIDSQIEGVKFNIEDKRTSVNRAVGSLAVTLKNEADEAFFITLIKDLVITI